MKQKIFIIENQYSDYQTISANLEKYRHPGSKDGAFEVYPKEDDFEKVMDYIRIIICPDPTRQELGFVALEKYLKDLHIDFLILDYKLSGGESGGNGIGLLIVLQRLDFLKDIPYLFLTRSSQTMESVKKDMRTLGGSVTWVDKGFGGVTIRDEEYFKQRIINEIEQMLPKNRKRIFIEEAEKLQNKLSELEYDDLEEIVKKMIAEVKESADFPDDWTKKIKDLNTNGGLVTYKSVLRKIKLKTK